MTQWRRQQGLTRRDIRKGGGVEGRDMGPEHYDEVLGSSEFFVYLTPNKAPKGYPDLKEYLESLGCTVEFPAQSALRPTERHQVVKITFQGLIIPDGGLRRAHRWAHQRNYLHHFFRPLIRPGGPAK